MANYIIKSCDGQNQIVVEINEGLPDSTYFFTFTGETAIGCYNIISATTDPSIDTIDGFTGYSNCLLCLQENNYSFFVTGCTLPTGGPVNATQFSEFPLGKYYRLCAPTNEFFGCSCFEVIGIQEGLYPFSFQIDGPYTNCLCENAPRSANTESFICEICCPCTTDSTITSVSPPHPVWTDGRGVSVTQLNMVVLGGENGLNN